MRLVYDSTRLTGVTTARPGVPDSRLNRIDRILIPTKYTFFFESPPAKNFEG
jgi:hypothetical protein